MATTGASERAESPNGAKVAEQVAAARAGDRGAFTGLVETHRNLVFSISLSLTGSVSEAEEAAQETFVIAWSKLRELRKPDRFPSWLCTIARNASLQTLRLRAGSRDVRPELPSSDPSPLDRVITLEEQAVLRRALGAIPEGYRTPLVLFYQEQQTMAAIAEALDLSVENVRQRVSRGRRMIQQDLVTFVESALPRARVGNAFTAAVMGALVARPRLAAAGSSERRRNSLGSGKRWWPTGLVGSGLMLALAGVWRTTPDPHSGRGPRHVDLRWSHPAPSRASGGSLPPFMSASNASVGRAPLQTIPKLGRLILHFDFEDGLSPEMGVRGLTMDCPPRPGNAYCMAGELAEGFLVAAFARDGWLRYSPDLVLSFDYWILGEGLQIQIAADSLPPASNQYYLNIDRAAKGEWAHVDLPLRDARDGKTGQAMKDGGWMGSFSFVFAGGYRSGQALWVDNISLSREESQ